MNNALLKLDASAKPLATTHAIVHDTRTGLMWTADNVGNGRMSHTAATQAAAGVALGGFTDWRLPTVQELLTLVDYGRFNPAIDTDAFRCESSGYWTSSPGASAPAGFAWFVGFDYGGSLYGGRSDLAFVRAVRSVGAGQ